MAQHDKVSTRYARAILDSVGDAGKAAKIVEELRGFSALVEGHEDLKHVLGSALFSEKQRADVISDLTDKLKVSADAKRILLVISELNRVGQLSGIASRLNTLLLEKSDVIPLDVRVAAPLNDTDKKAVEARFAKVLGKKVSANYTPDPTLVGGIRVTAAGKTYDGSVVGWLNQFEEQLFEGSM